MSVSRSSQASARASANPPPRRLVPVMLPVIVIVATALLVGWTAWPALRPVPRVAVVQVLPPTSNAGDGVDSAASDAADATPDASADTVRLASASPRAPGVTVQAPGWLEADPFFIAVAALQNGTLDTVGVLEGEPVVAGQVVARLIDEDVQLALKAADAMLETAMARQRIAAADLAAAEIDLAEPIELERAVAEQAALIAEADAELALLPTLIQVAQADLVRLNEERDRAEASEARGGATGLEVIIARQRAAAQLATLESIRAREPRLAAHLRRHQANHRAAVRTLELKTDERRRRDGGRAEVDRAAADVAMARVQRDEAQLAVDRTVIRAPIDGFVLRRLKVPGDTVMREMDDPHAAHIIHVYDPASLQVRVDVPLADASHVRPGQTCEVVVDVLPDRIFRGTVTRITHEADLQKNTLQVKVRVEDPSPLLRPEMLTRVKFLPGGTPPAGAGAAGSASRPGSGRQAGTSASAGTSPDPAAARSTVRIPVSAIAGDGTVSAVRQRRGDRGVIESVAVEGGQRDGQWLTATVALRPGDLLVDQSLAVAPAPGSIVQIQVDPIGGAS
ncbi:MAG: HlyD family secretion protein [Phycisphaerales bacterium]